MTHPRAYGKMANELGGQEKRSVWERQGGQDHKTGKRREKMRKIKENEIRKTGK